ncbi:LysR family transcriptional regulator [Stenotrophomonas sp. KAs 5-3]|nr:LysR family transcriptional regulator [Stenotrophomonas sp. KAs 5-3]
MPLPDLNLLLALDVLIDECSVAAAARRMNLSAPAMSRTLKPRSWPKRPFNDKRSP